MESGVTRLPLGRVSAERWYDSEHFFFWMTVIENLPEYTFQRALSYADPDNVEELARLAGGLRLAVVTPTNWTFDSKLKAALPGPEDLDLAAGYFSRGSEQRKIQLLGQDERGPGVQGIDSALASSCKGCGRNGAYWEPLVDHRESQPNLHLDPFRMAFMPGC